MAEKAKEKILNDEIRNRYRLQSEELEILIQGLISLMNVLKNGEEDVNDWILDFLNYDTLSDETATRKLLMDLFNIRGKYTKGIEELQVPVKGIKKVQEEIENRIVELSADDSTTEDKATAEDDEASEEKDPTAPASTSGGAPQTNATEEEEHKEPK